MVTTIVFILFFLGGVGFIFYFLLFPLLFSKNPKVLMTLIRQKKYNQAIKICNRALARNRKDVDTLFLLGEVYWETNRKSEAYKLYKEVNEIGQFTGICKEEKFRKKMGNLFIERGELQEGLKEFLLLIEKEPNDSNHYYQVGEIYERIVGRETQALNFYNKSLEVYPGNREARLRISILLYKKGDIVNASYHLGLLLSGDPLNPKAALLMGKIEKQKKVFPEAIKWFTTAAKSDNKEASVEIGECYIKLKDYDRAILSFLDLIEKNPNDNSPIMLIGRYSLAACYFKKEQIGEALKQWHLIYRVNASFKNVKELLNKYKVASNSKIMENFFSKSNFEKTGKEIIKRLNMTIHEKIPAATGAEAEAEYICFKEKSDSDSGEARQPILVRIERNDSYVAEEAIRQFNESMRAAKISKGIYVVNSDFHKKAVAFSETRLIELVNSKKLQELLRD